MLRTGAGFECLLGGNLQCVLMSTCLLCFWVLYVCMYVCMTFYMSGIVYSIPHSRKTFFFSRVLGRPLIDRTTTGSFDVIIFNFLSGYPDIHMAGHILASYPDLYIPLKRYRSGYEASHIPLASKTKLCVRRFSIKKACAANICKIVNKNGETKM